MVHTCPRCELRFTTSTELADHLASDHDVDTLALIAQERYHYEGKHRPGGARGRRYLVVANQTLLGGELQEEIRRRAQEGGATFYLLVPAAPQDRDLGLALYRLREMVDKLHTDGIDAEGEVAEQDPYKAVAELLERKSFDEVIVSTLPSGLSRWLQADLSERVKRRFGLAVSTVTQSA